MLKPIVTTAAAIALTVATCSAFALTVERQVKVNGKTCDVVTWTDAGGKERSAALVRATGDGKYSGGYVERFTYLAGDAQRVCKSDETMSNVSGMGVAVNHHKSASTSKANSANASTDFLFAGASHALWRFKSDYSGVGKTIGLVIDYTFADGRSDFGWAVSYDCSKLADKEVNWDARGPYFQFDWDGDGKFFGAPISGIRWGDRYHFRTVKYDKGKSEWDYSKPNTIPYMMLYKEGANGDAECGVVATVPWDQKDAGGYWWASKNWGKTGTGMMENWNCPFQLNAYEGYGGEKMAWGTPFGFVGAAKYQAVDMKSQRSGYPYQGYAVRIVLGRHSDGGVDAAIADLEAAQKTKVTASTGKVVTRGAAFAGLDAQADWATPGWDPVAGVWTVACEQGRARVSIDVGQGSLANPTFCFTEYSGKTAPTIKLGAAALADPKDVHVSVDSAAKRLYVTLNRRIEGAGQVIALAE
jgi:hypothetical protein